MIHTTIHNMIHTIIHIMIHNMIHDMIRNMIHMIHDMINNMIRNMIHKINNENSEYRKRKTWKIPDVVMLLLLRRQLKNVATFCAFEEFRN